MQSVRGRLTLLVLVVLTAVLGTAGFALDHQIRDRERTAFDTRLERTLKLSEATAVAAVIEALPDADRRLDAVLRADESTLRLTLAGRMLYRAGAKLPLRVPQQVPDGLSTIETGGQTFRSFGARLNDPEVGKLARLELIASLDELQARERDRRWRIIIVLAATLILAGLGTLLAADLVLRPLRRLRRTTSAIAAERDLAIRVPVTDGLSEIRTLAESFNAMLARLQASASSRQRAFDATRRFTADAGHELRTPMTALGTTLELLGRADLPDEQRKELAVDAGEEQARLVALLDGLSALARGEASPIERSVVDLADMTDQVVITLGSQYPGAKLSARLPDGALLLSGWEPGLRLIVENLIRNAVIHSGVQPQVRVTVTADIGAVEVIVEDDGGGIAPAERQHVFEPFVRVGTNSAPGSGLGLALVAQQAAQHGGVVRVDESPELGGARFTVRIPTDG